MAQQGKNIVDLEKEIQLLKDKNKILSDAQGATGANNARIKRNLKEIEDIEKRILKLKKGTREEVEDTVDATEKLKNISNDLTKLAAKEAKLAKGKKGILLGIRGIDIKNAGIREKILKGEAKSGRRFAEDERNALKELEKLRLDGLENVMNETFDLEAYKADIDEVLEGIANPNIKAIGEELKSSGETWDANASGLSKLMDLDLPLLDDLDKVTGAVDTIKSIFTDWKIVAVAAVGLMLNEVKKLVGKTKELRQELGISASHSADMALNMRMAQLQAFLLLGDTEKAAESIKAFAETTSQVGNLTADARNNLARIASLAGTSAETTADLVKMNAILGKTSIERSGYELEILMNLSKQQGVLSSKVFEDIATISKESSIGFGKTADEIARAAIEMRKLTLSADVLERVSESVLDLEGAISSEFQQQALFGKSVNMNQLQRLAHERDFVSLGKELKAQMKGFTDLTKLNSAQAKVLKDTFNLTNTELTALINGTLQLEGSTDAASQAMGTFQKHAILIGGVLGGVAGILIAMIPAMRAALTYGKSAPAEAKAVMAGMKTLGIGMTGGAVMGAGIGFLAKNATPRMENWTAMTGVKRKGVLDSQIEGFNESLGDNHKLMISADKRVQKEVDFRTDEYTKEQRKNTEAIKSSEVAIVGAVNELKNSNNGVMRAIHNLKRGD